MRMSSVSTFCLQGREGEVELMILTYFPKKIQGKQTNKQKNSNPDKKAKKLGDIFSNVCWATLHWTIDDKIWWQNVLGEMRNVFLTK